jgi:glycosyltransferase involved in cell wall biosynthesis
MLGDIMLFSIITPSYRSAQWLRLCIASVADQQGVAVEHIVQDSCSDDGTQDWLPKDPRVQAFIEKDRGMYDAINRGLRRAKGDFLAYLNCDEQYLPGTLAAVQEHFAAHPQLDAVLADTIVTNAEGGYICHRCALVPARYETWVRFPVQSCALFLRRRVVAELGLYLDPQWKALGDLFWVMDMIKRGVRMGVLRRFTSTFADTGGNLCLTPAAVKEIERKRQMAPRWVRWTEGAFVLKYRLRLAARGANSVQPFDYSLYALASPEQRVTRHAAKPTSFWPGR